MKRIFVALRFFPAPRFIDIYKEIKVFLKDEKIRWVKTDNLHITLRYIGEHEN
ncbi:MAG: 2'-5' RNA ligase family protein, partial [Bacteroidota bacterium]